MNKPRPSRVGQLASIQTTPAVARSFRREADKLGLNRRVFLAVLLRGWTFLPDDVKHEMTRAK